MGRESGTETNPRSTFLPSPMQLENYEEGAKCLFSFYFYNPEDELATTNFPFYRRQLELKEGEFVWREPGIQPHQAAYLAGICRGQFIPHL